MSLKKGHKIQEIMKKSNFFYIKIYKKDKKEVLNNKNIPR